MKYTELEKRKEQERATASAANQREKHPGYLAWKERRAKQERDKDAPSAYETYKARREARQAAKQKEATEMVNRLLEETNRTSSTYRSRYGDGKRGYRADADQWLEELNRSRETSRGMAAELSKYLNENRAMLGDDFLRQATEAVNQGRHFQRLAAEEAQRERDYFSQWESEDAYNLDMQRWQEQEEMRNFDTKAGAREIGQLENTLKEYRNLSRWETDEKGRQRLEELREQYGDEKGIQDLISQKSSYLTQARRLQEADALGAVSGNADFRDMSRSQADIQDVQYRYINDEEYRRQYDGMVGGAYNNLHEAGLDILTDDEKNIYNYHYAKDGKEKAQEYLNSIREQLNYRRAAERFESYDDHTLLEMAFGVEAGIDQFQSGMRSALWNGEGDYVAPSSRQMLSGMVREDLGEKSGFAQGAYDVITTTANMAPSIMVSALADVLAPGSGSFIGAGMLGMSSGGSAYQEMINRGYSKEQSRTYGMLVGASEAVLGELLGGISKLGGKLSGKALTGILNKVDNVFLRTIGKIGGNMISEGGEEMLQEVLTPWFESILTGEEYQVQSEDVWYAGLLGALSAGLLEGPTTISGEYGSYRQGVELQEAGIKPERLKAIGQTFAADTVAYRLAGRVDENTDAYTLGRLFNEIDAELTQMNKDSITSSLMSKGVDERSAKKLAEGFGAVLSGAPMTEQQAAAIAMNDVLVETVREVILDENSTANQRNLGFNELLRDLDRKQSGEVAAPAAAEQQKQVLQASTEGRARLLDTEETVTVQGVDSVRDGKVMLKLEDGRTVSAEDVVFGSEGDAMVYSTVAEMNLHPRVANILLENYRNESTDGEVYAKGIQEAYRFGENNYPMEQAAKGPFTSMLTQHQWESAYQLGQAFGTERIAAAQKAAKTAAAQNFGTGRVHFDGDRTLLNQRQQTSLKALDLVANAMGIQIHVFESKTDSKGVGTGKNGWFDPRDNSIHIDLHAGSQGADTMLFTAAHELTHFVKKWSPEKFRTLSDFLMGEYGRADVDVETLVQGQIQLAAKNNRKLSYDEAFEEVIADSMETLLADGDVVAKLEKLKTKDRSLWEHIRDFVMDLAGKIRKVYEGLTADSPEGRHVAEMVGAMDRLKELFTEGLSDAGTNYQAAMERGEKTQKNTADEGGVMYQARKGGYDYSVPFAQQVVDWLNGIFPQNDTLLIGGTPEVLVRIGFPRLPLTITQVNLKANLKGEYRGTQEEILDHIVSSDDFKRLPELISEPVAIIADRRLQNNKWTVSGHVVDVLVEMEINGKRTLVPLKVDGKGRQNDTTIDSISISSVHGNRDALDRLEYALNNDSDSNILAFFVDKNKATSVLRRAGYTITGWPNIDDGFNHSITDPNSPVKLRITSQTETRQFKKWFGDSKVVNADGTPKVMYHGSPAQFTIFDKKKAKSSGHYGRGFYFTDSDSHAGTYGNLYSVYLNIRNPLQNGVSKVSRDQVRAYLEAVAENEDYSIENYGTYDVERILKTVMGSAGKKDAFQVIQDISATAIGDMVEAAELFNSVNGTDFDGIIVPTETVAFRPEQIKSATDNIGTFDGENPDIRYQERRGKEKSDPRKAMAEYKARVDERYDKKLREHRETAAALRSDLREARRDTRIMEKEFIRIARAYEKDTQRARRQQEADAARISRLKDTVDEKIRMRKDRETEIAGLKQALQEEARSHRQDQATWEKEFARLLREYETADRSIERMEATIARQRERAREKVESRRRTEMRHKIRNFKEKMQTALLRPTDNQYVPVSLINAMVDLCSLIDTDTELYKADGSVNQAQQAREETKQKLQRLKDEYEKLKENGDPMYAGEFDEYIYNYITDIQENYSGRSLTEMSLDELRELYENLKAIDETLADARKLIGWGDAEGVYEAGDAIIAEQAEITRGRKNGRRNGAQQAVDGSLNLSLSPVRNVERMSGYNQGSVLLKLFKGFERGVRKKNMFIMEAYKSFERLTAGKVYESAVYEDVGGKVYEDTEGRKFGISKMQMMQAVLSWEREQANNMHHIETGGFTFADLGMLQKGRLRDAISAEYSHRMPNAVELVAQFQEILKEDSWCQEYMEAARKFFNEKAKDAVNETTIALKHRIVAKDKSYIPFEVDKDYIVREISAQNDIQQTINSYGMLKDTQDHAPQPLIMTGLNNILDRHIEQVGSIYGLAVEVRNFNKVWNVKSAEAPYSDPTVRAAVRRNWGNDGVKHIEQAVQDIQGPRVSSQSELYKKVKSGYINATFLLNLSVVTKQVGSLFAATSMLKWRGPARMIGNLAYTMANQKKLAAEVDKYTATAWMRRQGLSDAELHSFLTQPRSSWVGKLAGKLPTALSPGKWISAMDHAVALSLWKYAKQDTAKRTGLTGEALLQATAEFYDEVIENTQSMSDILHRPEIQKRSDVFSEALGMFKTDLYQMAGQLQVTAGRLAANNTKENRQAMGRTVYAVAMGALWGQLMTTAFALLRYKVNQYRDEEDEDLTMESWLKRQGFGLAADFAGYIFPLFGGEIVGVFENIMYGESDDIVDNVTLTAVNDLYGTVVSIGSKLKEGEELKWTDYRKIASKALQVFGIPLNNILRTLDAVQLHAQDIANGEFLSFEAGVDRTNKQHIHRISEAMDAGNIDVAKGLFEEAVEEAALAKAKGGEVGEDELKAARSGLKSALGTRYKDGELSEDLVRRMLAELFDQNEEDIHWTMEEWTFDKENDSEEDYGKYNKFYEAVRTGADLKKTIKEYTDNGVVQKTLISQITGHFKEEYTGMSKKDRAAMKGYLVNGFVYCGMSREDALEKIAQWDVEAEYGISYGERYDAYLAGRITARDLEKILTGTAGMSDEDAAEKIAELDVEKKYGFRYEDRRTAYRDGKITKGQLKEALMGYGGMTEVQAERQIKVYEWQNEGFDISNEQVSVIEDYETFCEPAKISREIYWDAYLYYKNSGSSAKNSKVKACMPYIDKLPLTSEQKTALALCWWAESTVKRYKTW